MARIPTYTTQSRAARQSGTPRARGIPVQDFSSPGLIQAGNDLSRIGATLLKAADDDAAHQARVNAQLKLSELETELQTEDPMQALSVYDTRAEQIIEEAGAGLSSNAADTFRSAAREMVARSKISVQKDGIRRGREKLEGNLVTGISGNVSAIRSDDTAADRQTRLDNVREMIDQSVANRVIAADTGARLLVKYQQDADSARASFDIQKNPVAFLEAADSEYTALTGEQRAKFTRQAKAKIERDRKAAEVEANAADKAYMQELNARIKAASRGQRLSEADQAMLDPEAIRASLNNKELAAVAVKQTQDVLAFIDDTAGLEERSNADLTALVTKYREDADVAGDLELSDQNFRQAQNITKRVQQIIKQRVEDPAMAAMQSSDAVRRRYDDFTADPDDPFRYAAYAAVRDAEYERLGINIADRRLLPKGMAAQEVKNFAGLEAPAAADRILELRTGLGLDWPKALNELQREGLDKRTSMLMSVDDPQTRDRLVQAMQQGTNEEFRSQINKALLKDFDKIRTEMMMKVNAAAQMPGAANATALSDAVELIALQKLRFDPSMKTPKQAIEAAYKEVVTDQYHIIQSDRIRGIIAKSDNPEGIDEKATQRALVRWVQRNPDVQYNRNLFPGIPSGIEGAEAQEKIRAGLRGTAQWQIDGDGERAQLHVKGNPVYDANNKPIIVDIDNEILADKEAQARAAREGNPATTRMRATIRGAGR